MATLHPLMFHVKRSALAAGLFATAAGAALSGCGTVSKDLVTGNDRALGYTWAQQVQIGRESDPQILAQFGAYPSESLEQYVSRIGQKIVAVSHLRQGGGSVVGLQRPGVPADVLNTPVTFRVLDSPIINAMALPGGYIYVTRGLLANLENEAQLAVVLGHEVAHVARQHAARQAYQAQRAQLGLVGAVIAGSLLGGTAGQVANALGQYGGQGLQLLLLKYGRDAEEESDRLGVEYASLAGYDASQAADFFISLKRLQQRDGAALPTWMSSHPDPGDREGNIRRMAAEWLTRYPQLPRAVNEADLDAQTNGIIFGENPRQGFVQNGVFYHPEMAFQYTIPQGWQVQNDASMVSFADGRGQSIGQLHLAQGSSAETAARQFASQQGIQVLQSGRDNVNGLPAYVVAAQAQTQQGVIQTIQYFIEYNGRVYNFAALGTQQGLAAAQQVYVNIFKSFRPLTDQRMLARQPNRMNFITATRAGTLASFQPSPLPTGVTLEDVAIANQVQVNAQVQPGARFKIVRSGN